MSLWIDVKYASMLVSQLGCFKIKQNKPFMANFRCHYCGDSDKSRSKTRGYILEKSSDRLLYYCHNCGKSTAFGNALKDIDPILHDEYKLEKIKELGSIRALTPVVEEDKFKSDMSRFATTRLDLFAKKYGWKKVSSLAVNHPVKKYVENRKIPTNLHHKLFYSTKYMSMVNAVLPDKFSKEALKYDEPRLVIPFLDTEGRVFAFQGRSFDPKSKTKYITIVLDESMPRIYGLDTLNRLLDTIVLEGPIDSMFLENAIALGGGENSDIERVVSRDKAIFVFDNEPRSKDTIRRIEKAIDGGFRVFLFPENIKSKDINDMIKIEGYDSQELHAMIVRGAVSGMLAKLQLSEWKKV